MLTLLSMSFISLSSSSSSSTSSSLSSACNNRRMMTTLILLQTLLLSSAELGGLQQKIPNDVDDRDGSRQHAAAAAAELLRSESLKEDSSDESFGSSRGSCQWTVLDIPRVHVNDIASVEDFWNTYSEAPLILTGIVDDTWGLGNQKEETTTTTTTTTTHNSPVWDFTDLADLCANVDMPVMTQVNDPKQWANLGFAGTRKLDRFIKYVLKESSKVEHPLYGFDLPINEDCPALLDYFKIPRFFNECLLQSNEVQEHFKEQFGIDHSPYGWPTMMIGPSGSNSALHIDNNGLPFWMTLLNGRKHWRVLPYKDNYHNTGPDPTGEFIPPPYGVPFRGLVLEEYYGGGTYSFDGFDPDFEEYPTLCDAVVYDGILEAGEIIYVPNSAPHGVKNLEHTIAITANFFHPLDRAQGEWLDQNCHADTAEQRGYTPHICKYMYNRIWHRKEYWGPQEDLDYATYENDRYFQQVFDEEL